MDTPYISKEGRVQLTIIEQRLLDLYAAGVAEENTRIMHILYGLLQNKDAQEDQIAVAVLKYAIDKINQAS